MLNLNVECLRVRVRIRVRVRVLARIANFPSIAQHSATRLQLGFRRGFKDAVL